MWTPIFSIKLHREGSVKTKKAILDSREAYLVFAELAKEVDREEFWILGLDAQSKPIGAMKSSVGTLSMAVIHPREIFKFLFLCNSFSFMLAHNHPSGDPKPSPQDDAVTKGIFEASEVLKIKMLDHIIVGNETYYSYSQRGSLSSAGNKNRIV